MLGLDSAGKTTVLYNMKLGERVHTVPTIGFNCETIRFNKNVDLTIFDVGGQDRIRPLWKHYYEKTDAIIYVVDSSDSERTLESAEELQKLLMQDELRDAVLLVFANKQDLPGAQDVDTLSKKLGLTQCRSRQWYIQQSVATSGEGIYEGIDWMCNTLKKTQKNKN